VAAESDARFTTNAESAQPTQHAMARRQRGPDAIDAPAVMQARPSGSSRAAWIESGYENSIGPMLIEPPGIPGPVDLKGLSSPLIPATTPDMPSSMRARAASAMWSPWNRRRRLFDRGLFA
jgi:hypothetical protein